MHLKTGKITKGFTAVLKILEREPGGEDCRNSGGGIMSVMMADHLPRMEFPGPVCFFLFLLWENNSILT